MTHFRLGGLVVFLAATLAMGCGDDGDDGGPIDSGGGDNQAPAASFSFTPACVDSGVETEVTLTDESTDPDMDTLSCTWSFDGGTGNTNQCDTTVTYPGARPYNVTLMVDDGNGGTDSVQMMVPLC